jgi:small-conductance mechanosensitive channel
VRAHEGRLAVDYLRQVLIRIGPVLPQEVPDDPAAGQPYVHFEHPLGRVVVARALDGAPRWQVAGETVESLRALFAAFERMPPDPEAAGAAPPPSGFFALRHWIGSHVPALLVRLGPVEAWQVAGIGLVMLAGWLLGHLAGWPATALMRWLAGATREEAARLRWPARLAAASGLWLAGSGVLGLPEIVQAAMHLLFTTTLALAAAWGGWHLVDGLARRLGERAQRSSTQVDEIMVSLVAGAAKVGLVVGALLWVATALSVPVAGIIAGLGVGGIAFAFASRETLQNVFGAGILLTDRPFRRGDAIIAGDVRGTVEKVGIRSTRIRTAEDSVVVVPNGRLADATINNMGTRRQRLVTGKVTIGWTARPEQVDAFIEGIRTILEDRPDIAQERSLVGATGLGLAGIEVEFTAYLTSPSLAAERAARHALLREVLALAHRLGLPSPDPGEDGPSALTGRGEAVPAAPRIAAE